jgi:hypothetical protein
MPASAQKALEGMLAEGVEADEVLARLTDAGYDVKPPEGDGSYPGGGDEDEDGGLVVAIDVGEEDEGGPKGPPKPPFGGIKPGPDRYKSAAKATMKKHGLKADEDE